MPKCVVIADDLTGANATGVLLQKMNYSAYTVLNTERLELSLLSDCDSVLYPTDSRGIDKELAYRRVFNVCNLLKNPETEVYGKRIDSTLRGNLCDAGCSRKRVYRHCCSLLSEFVPNCSRGVYVGRGATTPQDGYCD